MSTQVASDDIKHRDVFGSFLLRDAEFAISADSIQEVVNELSSYTTIPLSPTYLLGLFNLRGTVIPVVDLRSLFRFGDASKVSQDESDENSSDKQIIAIIEYGKLHVGILFDKTGEVFDGGDFEKVIFNKSNQASHDVIVQGAFKMDGGKRIVQIIDPIEVLNLKKVPKSTAAIDPSQIREAKKRSQCISFRVGGFTCALKINEIKEILTIDNIDNTVFAGDKCLGAVDVRGSTVPIVDSYALLGSETDSEREKELESRSKIVVVTEVEHVLVGLIVDSIENIISYYNDDLVPFPTIGENSVDMFDGCIYVKNEIEAIMIDHDKILSDPDISAMVHRHEKFFKEKEHVSAKNDKKNLDRKSYIIFSVDDRYALEISEVNEGIDYPDDIIIPPSLPKYITGVINLRGNPIPVIDTRAIFGLEESSSKSDQKILIFQLNGDSYGLVVDSIDSIMSINNDQVMSDNLSDGVKNILEMKEKIDDQRYVIVFNLEHIVSRLGEESLDGAPLQLGELEEAPADHIDKAS